MYFNAKVAIPENTGKITFNRRGDTTYVEYTYDRIYDPQKQYNIPKRTTIGKQCTDDITMMFPNPNFQKYFPEIEIPELGITENARCNMLRIGAFLVIRKIIEDYGLDQMLKRIIGRDSGLFQDFAAYTIVTEGNAAQYYPEYAYDHPLMTYKMRMYSDSKLSDFLQQITIDQSVAFLNEWNAGRDHRERIYISYDSTNKACEAGDITLAEPGHAKDGGDDPIYNFSIAFDHNNREPLFYEEYLGSIVDISQLQYMLETARGYGYRKVGFILDRGYFSAGNIRFMDHNECNFVIMVKGKKDLVSELVLGQKGTFEDKWANTIREYDLDGTTVKRKLFETDEKERYFHIYYSGRRHAEERANLKKKLDHMERNLKKLQDSVREINIKEYGHYFDPIYFHEGQEDQCFLGARIKGDVVEREISLGGYFVLITSEKMTAKEALLLYKSRDEMEKLFRGDKSFLGGQCVRVHSEEAMGSKTFIEFVALIIRNRMYTCLKDAMMEADNRQNYLTVPAAIRQLEHIEMIRGNDRIYRLDHAVTKKQKDILRAFGMDVNYIKKEAKNISDQIAEYEGVIEYGKDKEKSKSR